MIIFVSDIFAHQYVGGAELTTEAIIKGTDLPVLKLNSSEITHEYVNKLSDFYWIFGNFAGISHDVLMEITTRLNYSVVEYDYKFCKFRLPEKHEALEGECDCHLSTHGRLVALFYNNAKTLWFMSAAQQEIILNRFPFLRKKNSEVLSSVFCKDTLNRIENLRNSVTEKDKKWLIQKSDSWVKGTEDSVKFATENDLDFEVFQGLSYDLMLDKFAKSKGFVFMPRGADTCPRTVIEAKLLGCELELNENVQHKDEDWFSGGHQECLDYLSTRTDYFWKSNESYIPYDLPKANDLNPDTHFKIIVPSYNCEQWISKTITSIQEQDYKNFECVIVDDISTDKTLEVVKDKISGLSQFSVITNTEKKFALRNINDTIQSLSPDPQDVIVLLDGDDWFSTPRCLDQLNYYYQTTGCYMTFGSFVRHPDGNIGLESSEYPNHIIADRSFRSDDWRASHLKTYKTFLWDNLNTDDLKDEEGNFFENCYDQAIMLPLLEMSAPNIKFIPEVLCVYNVGNPNAVNKTRVNKQYNNMLKIRDKKPYDRIDK
jgi:hypothetical protein